MKTSKKLVAMALVSCMAVGSTMNFANAANVKADETAKTQVETQNVEPRGKVRFWDYVTKGSSNLIHEDSNWWPSDDVATIKMLKTEGPTRLSIRIEQKVGGEWLWAGSGSISTKGEEVEAQLKEGGTAIRIFAYIEEGPSGRCKFELNLTH